MSEFKLLTYSADGKMRAAILVGDKVIDTAQALEGTGIADAGSVLGVLKQWDKALPALERAADKPAGGRALAGLRLEAPIQVPGAYFCAAANYYDHFKEMNPDREFKKEGKEPYFFLKSGLHSTFGPHDPIQLPSSSKQIDWEIELGAVIGRPTRNATLKTAMDAIAGYTICNDVSARDLGRRADWPQFASDWFGQKVFDKSMGLGPWILPAKFVQDPYKLPMKLWVNDQLMQNSVAGQMVFNIAEQIEYISRRLTLQPGDVIATGTPAGVGRPRGIFLKAGDTVKLEIGSIGSMENKVVQGE
jgi:2-keto-4-pentenoate hydratase/2-oxohepta-3-ene-1,7-dioic acid hydratase in catechol pathway